MSTNTQELSRVLLACLAGALIQITAAQAQQTHPAPSPMPNQPSREGPYLPRSLPNGGQTQGNTPNVQPGSPGAPFQGTQIQNNQVMATPAPGQQKQSPTTAQAPGALQLPPYKQRLDQLGQMLGVPHATLSVLWLGLVFLTITCVMVGILLAKYVTLPETVARKRY